MQKFIVPPPSPYSTPRGKVEDRNSSRVAGHPAPSKKQTDQTRASKSAYPSQASLGSIRANTTVYL